MLRNMAFLAKQNDDQIAINFRLDVLVRYDTGFSTEQLDLRGSLRHDQPPLVTDMARTIAPVRPSFGG